MAAKNESSFGCSVLRNNFAAIVEGESRKASDECNHRIPHIRKRYRHRNNKSKSEKKKIENIFLVTAREKNIIHLNF